MGEWAKGEWANGTNGEWLQRPWLQRLRAEARDLLQPLALDQTRWHTPTR
jgi:hypothetical protein